MFLAHIKGRDGLVAQCHSEYMRNCYDRLYKSSIYTKGTPAEKIGLDILINIHITVFTPLLCNTGEEAARNQDELTQFTLGVFHELIQMINVVDMVLGAEEALDNLLAEQMNYLTDPQHVLLDVTGSEDSGTKACLAAIDENLPELDRLSRQMDCYMQNVPPAMQIAKEVVFELADFIFNCDSVDFRDGSYNLCWHRGGRVVGFILPFFVSGGGNAASKIKRIAGVTVDASEIQKAVNVIKQGHQPHHTIKRPGRRQLVVEGPDNTITMTIDEHGKVSVVRETKIRKIDVIYKDAQVIVSMRENPHQIIGEGDLNREGMISLHIDTKNGVNSNLVGHVDIRGEEVFDAIHNKLVDVEGLANIKGIKAQWVYGDNLATFNKLIIEEVNLGKITMQEAALETFTGRMARKYGYNKVLKITGTQNVDGTYKYVYIDFVKP